MYSKWIKSGFVLAMLLVSMVSLSMAACPWLIKNELYNAQCGVEKVVPASAGLLANDPGATAVLDPDSITIDAKYGTLDKPVLAGILPLVSVRHANFLHNEVPAHVHRLSPGFGPLAGFQY